APSLSGSARVGASDVACRQVGTDRPGVIEANAGVDRESIANVHRFAREPAGGDECTPRRGRLARDRLKRLAAVVDVARASWNAAERVMLTLLGLASSLPLVIDAEEPWSIVGHG